MLIPDLERTASKSATAANQERAQRFDMLANSQSSSCGHLHLLVWLLMPLRSKSSVLVSCGVQSSVTCASSTGMQTTTAQISCVLLSTVVACCSED